MYVIMRGVLNECFHPVTDVVKDFLPVYVIGVRCAKRTCSSSN